MQSKVEERDTLHGNKLTFRISYEEVDSKLRKYNFNIGQKIVIIVRGKDD